MPKANPLSVAAYPLLRAISLMMMLLHLWPSAQAQPTQYLCQAAPKPGQEPPYLLQKTSPEAALPLHYEVVRRLDADHIIAYPRHAQARQNLEYWHVLGAANHQWKLAPALQRSLQQPDAQARFITLSLRDAEAFIRDAQARGITLRYTNTALHTLAVEATPRQIADWLLPHPQLLYADLAQRDIFTEAIVPGADLTVNRIGYLHQQQPDLQGQGRTVVIKEGMFSPEDIDLQGRILRTPIESARVEQHATAMASLIAGAGNTSEASKGVAPAATMASATINVPILPEPAQFFDTLGATVQNHSYGSAIQNTYGNEARAMDAHTQQLPHLLHVYSSGNRGTATDTAGTYANLPGYANLTGTFKQAKNVLLVGGSDSLYFIPTFASRGPAYDGRLKPEIVAYSPGGTSDGAALVSGIALLLQETYESQEGQLPPSSLLRATLANTADDVALTGPDYFSGYGNVNAYRAWRTLSQQQYLLDTLPATGASQTYPLTVPVGTRQVRVALAWIDPPANAGDFQALVNDLDLTLTTPDAQAILPWVLNPYPDVDSLDQPATRQRDALNNLEQVTWDTPTPGQYTITVSYPSGTGQQPFALHYFIDQEPTFQWTNPTSSQGWLVDELYFLRWEAAPELGRGDLQVSLNGGDWQTLRTDLNLQREYYGWRAPSTATAVQFRVVTAQGTYTSETTRVHPLIRPTVGLDCTDSLLLQWPPDPLASNYTIFRMGQQYLSPILTTTDTALIIAKADNYGEYFSVRPNLGQPYANYHSPAINYTRQGGICYIQGIFGLLDPAAGIATIDLRLSTTYHITGIQVQRIHEGTTQTIANIGNPGTTNPRIADPTIPAGTSYYTATITTLSGQQYQTDTTSILYVPANQILIFPNPSSTLDGFQIISNFDTTVTMQLLTPQGQVVLQTELNVYNDYVDTYTLNRGVYLYYIRTEDQVYSGKIILN